MDNQHMRYQTTQGILDDKLGHLCNLLHIHQAQYFLSLYKPPNCSHFETNHFPHKCRLGSSIHYNHLGNVQHKDNLEIKVSMLQHFHAEKFDLPSEQFEKIRPHSSRQSASEQATEHSRYSVSQILWHLDPRSSSL